MLTAEGDQDRDPTLAGRVALPRRADGERASNRYRRRLVDATTRRDARVMHATRLCLTAGVLAATLAVYASGVDAPVVPG